MARSRVAEIKREKRKAFFFRELVTLFQELGEREKPLADLYVSNVEISESGGICYLYLSSYKEPGEEIFHNVFNLLLLYKGALRQAFSQRVQVRYTPEIIFEYDKAKEKERRINGLLDKVHEDLQRYEPKGANVSSDDSTDENGQQEG